MVRDTTGRFRRLGQCFIDWATAAVGEGDTSQLSVSFTYHSSGPIYETLAQSMELDGMASYFCPNFFLRGEYNTYVLYCESNKVIIDNSTLTL